MHEPLPSSLRITSDIAEKRMRVETRVEELLDVAAAAFDKEGDETHSATDRQRFMDRVATEYSRYRFGQIDDEELFKRYEQIPLQHSLDVRPSALERARELLTEQAERFVDAAIDDVFYAQAKPAGRSVGR